MIADHKWPAFFCSLKTTCITHNCPQGTLSVEGMHRKQPGWRVKSQITTVKSRILSEVLIRTCELLKFDNVSVTPASSSGTPLWEAFCEILRLPQPHWLFRYVAAGRSRPVTMTGYRGWGKSSSRPGRRRNWRTINMLSASRGWVFDMSFAAAEQHWAAWIQNDIMTIHLDAPLETPVRTPSLRPKIKYKNKIQAGGTVFIKIFILCD